jgi:nitrogen fixation/metabolism regulation signal transduction histidine kinase
LQTEVARLSGELERANSELTNSLDENSRVRGFLAQILEWLPCGVLVLDAGQRLRVINPEARRLLMLDPSWLPEQGVALPAVIDRLLAESSSKSTLRKGNGHSTTPPALAISESPRPRWPGKTAPIRKRFGFCAM